jgi:hypothetical protein
LCSPRRVDPLSLCQGVGGHDVAIVIVHAQNRMSYILLCAFLTGLMFSAGTLTAKLTL